jgi:hypothetical protein
LTDKNDAYDKSLAPFGRLRAQKIFLEPIGAKNGAGAADF